MRERFLSNPFLIIPKVKNIKQSYLAIFFYSEHYARYSQIVRVYDVLHKVVNSKSKRQGKRKAESTTRGRTEMRIPKSRALGEKFTEIVYGSQDFLGSNVDSASLPWRPPQTVNTWIMEHWDLRQTSFN